MDGGREGSPSLGTKNAANRRELPSVQGIGRVFSTFALNISENFVWLTEFSLLWEHHSRNMAYTSEVRQQPHRPCPNSPFRQR
ncbi:hypothetical protein D3C71_1848570 [compost metagenome]